MPKPQKILFKSFFNRKSGKTQRLSKVDYWKKFELFELFDNLNKAKNLLLDILSDNKHQCQIADFKNKLIEEIREIEHENSADYSRIWEWFSPTKEWDTLLGTRGKELGQNIFRITDMWKRSQDKTNDKRIQ